MKKNAFTAHRVFITFATVALFSLCVCGFTSAERFLAQQAPVSGSSSPGNESETVRQNGKDYIRQAQNMAEQGRHQEAARLFLLALDDYPRLADGVLDEAARAQVAAKDYPAAIATLKRLASGFPNRPIARDVFSRLARVYQLQGNDDQAIIMHHKAALKATSTAEKAYHWVQAGEILEKRGELTEAATLYQNVIDRLEPNRYSLRALFRFHHVSFGDDGSKIYKHATAFGARMFKAEAYQQAGPALDRAVKIRLQNGETISAMRELIAKTAFSLYKTHDNDKAIVYFEQILDPQKDDYEDTLYYLAKLHTREGKAEKARTYYEKLLSVSASAGYRRTALYQIQLLNMEEKKYHAAHTYFTGRLKQAGGNREFLEWLTAWSGYRAGKIDTALLHLKKIMQLRRIREGNRAKYWLGILLLENGQTEQGLAVLKDLNKRQPADYYGWRSAEVLREQRRPARLLRDAMDPANGNRYEIQPLAAGWWKKYPELALLGKALSYLEVGLLRAAAAELRINELPKKISSREAYEFAMICHRAKQYALARKVASKGKIYNYLRNSDQSMLTTYYPLYMPTGYAAHVIRYAKQYDLPPALVFALILNESGYRPQVVSPAYAVGLMQILPQTGAMIAGELQETFDEESLYDPETNIRFGCWYIRHLLNELGSDVSHAIAAYNAGPKAVRKWLRHKPELAQEIFVEEIAYQETKKYVRRVLTSYHKYEVILTVD